VLTLNFYEQGLLVGLLHERRGASLLDQLNRGLNGDRRSGCVGLRQVEEREHGRLRYKERLESSYLLFLGVVFC